MNTYVRHSHLRTNPAAEDIVDLLQQQLEDNEVTYLVVHAIDECAEDDGIRYLFMNALLYLREAVPLNILLTSRFVPLLQQKFSTVPNLEIRADRNDVRKYLEANMFRLASCVQREASLQEMIVEQICNVVNGM